MRPRARTVFKIFICRYPISPRAVAQIVVQAPGGFEWATEPNPTGAALAEFFPSTSPGQGDLYINPEVKSDLAAAGRHTAAGRFDGKFDSVDERRSPHRDDRLSGPGRAQIP